LNEFLDWSDSKYVPRTLDEMIGNSWAVKKLKRFAVNRNFPHLLLFGPPGTGKSSAVRCLIHDCFGDEAEFKEINASMDRGIKVIREDVKGFASTMPMSNVPFKVFFMDEYDLSNDAQESLRGIMIQHSKVCRFIIAANELYVVRPAIRSRCGTPIRFEPIPLDLIEKRLREISLLEKAEIHEESLNLIAKNANGDLRVAIKTLQSLIEGRTDPVLKEEVEASLVHPDVESIGEVIVTALKGRFTEAVNLFRKLRINCSAFTFANVVFEKFIDSNFDESEKIKIAKALGRINVYADDKFQIYSFLASISEE